MGAMVEVVWALISPDGVEPSWMVSVFASVNLPLHHKVQKFSSGTGSPKWFWKKGCKRLWWWWCGVCLSIPVCLTVEFDSLSQNLTPVFLVYL